jgi:hypothetical protein
LSGGALICLACTRPCVDHQHHQKKKSKEERKRQRDRERGREEGREGGGREGRKKGGRKKERGREGKEKEKEGKIKASRLFKYNFYGVWFLLLSMEIFFLPEHLS